VGGLPPAGPSCYPSRMGYGFLADFVVGAHFLFVLFVVLGGFLALRWPRVIYFHLPAAAWGALVELWGWICPLTPLEKWLRRQGGLAGYQGGFIEHYILPVLYPAGLTRGVQLVLAAVVVTVNLLVYRRVFRPSRKRTAAASLQQ
jgi:Protein of Unknown function (DUF2784)